MFCKQMQSFLGEQYFCKKRQMFLKRTQIFLGEHNTFASECKVSLKNEILLQEKTNVLQANTT